MVKFNKNIRDYQYILSFDLAKRVSGYSLWDFKNDKILLCGIIDTHQAKSDFIWGYFYEEVTGVIQKAIDIIGGQNKSDLLFVTKEKLPTQNGPHSTIETLQGLAQAHSVFDLAVFHSGVEVYDYEGVHSVSVKAYFKTLIDGIEKPQKEDIASYIKSRFDKTRFDDYTYDVTDALAVALTLVGRKYEVDIKENIKGLKKELKVAKSAKKQEELNDQIQNLCELIA